MKGTVYFDNPVFHDLLAANHEILFALATTIDINASIQNALREIFSWLFDSFTHHLSYDNRLQYLNSH